MTSSSQVRIALIAGCLESGRDGVGDYTEGLGIEAAAAGCQIAMVALADRFVSEETRSDRAGLSVLRLAAGLPWSIRIARMRGMLDEFNPDWISLQFVPYSFHPRGWVHGLANRLKPLMLAHTGAARSRGCALHLMFHELWLGAGSGARWEHRVEGLWQRWLILRFVRGLCPHKVHTSNPHYEQILRKNGINAGVLPLFGSIPTDGPAPVRKEADAWMSVELEKIGIVPAERSGWWLFAVFGRIYEGWTPAAFLSAVLALDSQKGRRLALLSFGRESAEGESVLNSVGREFAGKVVVHRFGEQSPDRLAAAFRAVDFGLSTSPWRAIGKSSATVAMREHGLPVIVTRVEHDSGNYNFDPAMGDPLLLKFDAALPDRLSRLVREAPRSRRPEVAAQWLKALGHSSESLTQTAHRSGQLQ